MYVKSFGNPMIWKEVKKRCRRFSQYLSVLVQERRSDRISAAEKMKKKKKIKSRTEITCLIRHFAATAAFRKRDWTLLPV